MKEVFLSTLPAVTISTPPVPAQSISIESRGDTKRTRDTFVTPSELLLCANVMVGVLTELTSDNIHDLLSMITHHCS
jgi:hypothetical protein